MPVTRHFHPGAALLASTASEHTRGDSRSKTPSTQKYVSPYYFALVYAGLGQSDQALSWLERAWDEHSGHVVFLKVEAEWDPLRQDPRFADLVQRIGL